MEPDIKTKSDEAGVCPTDPAKGEEYKLIKKKNNGILYTCYWIIGKGLAHIFAALNISPDIITVSSLIFYIIAGIFFINGTYLGSILGGTMFFLGILMDCTDGKLARILNKTSDLGNWLDCNIDSIRNVLIYPPIALVLFQNSKSVIPIVFAFILITVTMMYAIIILRWNKFPFAKKVKEQYTNKSVVHKIAKQFYFYEGIEPLFCILCACLNKMHWFLYGWTLWMTCMYLVTTVLYGAKIATYDKKNIDEA